MESVSEMIVYILHILFILFVISVPFMNNNYLSLLHVILLPFIMFHWVLEDHTCSVVFVEKKVNKFLYNYEGPSFFSSLIEPIYDFKATHREYSTYIYGITITLWLMSVTKLGLKYKNGQISKLDDLFRH
jgi:hypothetical protein